MKTIKELITIILESGNTDPDFKFEKFKTKRTTNTGHIYVGATTFGPGHKYAGGKGATIMQHIKTGTNAGKFFAAGGASAGVTSKTTFHNTPEAAAADYHK